MKKFCIVLFITMCSCLNGFSQGKFALQEKEHDKIKFQLINNLIIIPVQVNGVELSFILDTGVSKPIIFNFVNLTKELKINETERIYLRGLGEGESVEALKSKNNIFRIGDALSIGQDLYAIFDPSLNFAPQLGVSIHGIIGFDLLKDLVVEINYSQKYLKLYSPETYQAKRCKKCEIFALDFYNNKPFINADVVINQKDIPVKLLIDTGGSDALWLFDDASIGIDIPEKYFDDFLGRGLSGSVYGKRSKIDQISFGSFDLKRVNTAFPDSTSISHARNYKERNGSVGGEILKRFNVTFNYSNKTISLKRNKNFKAPFYYNKSGIVLEHNGVRVVREIDKGAQLSTFNSKNVSVAKANMFISGSYKYVLAPAFTIVELRKNSPAHRAGLMLGDVILSVNGKHVHSYSLQDVTQLFYGEDGRRIKLLIDRKGIQMKFQFELESLL